MSETPRRVALLIETSNRYARDLLHGVHDWVNANQRWSLRLASPGAHRASLEWLNTWRGDGVIARVDSDAIAAALKRSRLPVVDVSAERRRSNFPRISIDNQAVARMAADHLLSKRFPVYAYCGDHRFLWSRQRGAAFVRLVRQRGAPCYEFEPKPHPAADAPARLSQWLRSLPKPVAVFACYDSRAHEVIEACHDLGFDVPNEVAVLGVDDDELICEFSDPPLSSVLPNARRTGYEAAALLSRLMESGSAATPGRSDSVRRASARPASGDYGDGKGGPKPTPLSEANSVRPGAAAVPGATPEIDPIRVVERRSTDVDAVADAHVVAALRYIRAHACDGIDVSDVLRAVPISRTLLERKFEQFVGDSPHRLIKRRQIERVCQLLTESDLPIAMIADMTGFESASYLSAVFRRETGTTPREFRDDARGS